VSLAQAAYARAADQTGLAVSLRLAGHSVAIVSDNGEGETNYLQRLGQTISEVRILAGLSQDQLATKLGRSAAALSRWENGKVAPSAWDLRRLADLLDVPADLLLYPPERPPSPVEIRLQQAVRDGAREQEIRDRRVQRSGLGRGGRPRRPQSPGQP
jgi:transcriptional regulator with XRE-family HTH domain